MKISLHTIARFEVLAGALAVMLVTLIVCVHVPYAERVLRDSAKLYGFWAIEERTLELKSRKAEMHEKNRQLDSLIKIHEHTMHTDESSIAAALYEQAEKSGMKTSKIEVGEKTSVEDRLETSVTVRGSGTYAEVGRFCEAVENLPAPVRVRLVSASGAGRGTIRAFIDFVLISQPEEAR